MSDCNCNFEHGVEETDKLRDLIAAGMDQLEASRLLWGSPAGDPA